MRKLPLVRTETQPRNSTSNCTNRHVYGVWCVYSVYGACMVCVCAYMCVWCGVRICVRVRVYACVRASVCVCGVCVYLRFWQFSGPDPQQWWCGLPAISEDGHDLSHFPPGRGKNVRMLGSFYCASNKVIRQGAFAVRQIKSYVRELPLCVK